MRWEWIDDYLMARRGVTKDLQPEWNWIRYQIGGKMFAAICLDDDDRPVYVTLKLDPTEGEFLRRQYEDVLPGYYCNKLHWNSIRPGGALPDEMGRALLDESYRLVLAGFPRKRQRELLGLSACGTDCGACGLFGAGCTGCSALDGKVFHAPAGKACPIFACASNKRRKATCAGCPELPCALWRDTRDPRLSDEAFEASIRERTARLDGIEARPEREGGGEGAL